MKFENREVGRLGEEAAEKYLIERGFEIIERNWGNKFGEIDIIARDGEKLVFVEVKTKRGLQFGTPEEMFSPGKKRKVKRMATMYLKGREVPCRIDMVAVELGQTNEILEIRYYDNV
jgi:putative endonuclease